MAIINPDREPIIQPARQHHVKKGEKNVSPTMAIRVARLAGVGVDDVLAGKYPLPGTCAHCGRGPG
jgi:hypothetical protein